MITRIILVHTPLHVYVGVCPHAYSTHTRTHKHTNAYMHGVPVAWCLTWWTVSSNSSRAITFTFGQFWRQHPTRHQLYGHLPPITKVRRTRHAGHCWRSIDELISDVLLWTSTYGRAKAGRPARTYIQQLREDTGCSPEDLPEAMNDKEEWQERVRDIRASVTTWWWW